MEFLQMKWYVLLLQLLKIVYCLSSLSMLLFKITIRLIRDMLLTDVCLLIFEYRDWVKLCKLSPYWAICMNTEELLALIWLLLQNQLWVTGWMKYVDFAQFCPVLRAVKFLGNPEERVSCLMHALLISLSVFSLYHDSYSYNFCRDTSVRSY